MALQYLIRLRKILVSRFNEAELRTLCFDLGVDYESLPGEGKNERARELVAYLDRYNRIPDLIKVGEEQRPEISWSGIHRSREKAAAGRSDRYLETRMEPGILVTTAVGILTQAALAIKGTKSFLGKYGAEAESIGKAIFELVEQYLESNTETRGEVEYFVKNPEQEKRQQAIADSLAALVQQNKPFRQELEKRVIEYQQVVPNELIEEATASVKVEVRISGDVRDSDVYTSGRDIIITGR